MSTYAQTIKCEILPGILTDHAFVYLELGLSKDNRGMGLWKLNTTLLNDQEYVQKINTIIDNVFVKTEDLNILDKWEFFKVDVAEFTKQYSKSKAK